MRQGIKIDGDGGEEARMDGLKKQGMGLGSNGDGLRDQGVGVGRVRGRVMEQE